jgi:hypothetical protein
MPRSKREVSVQWLAADAFCDLADRRRVRAMLGGCRSGCD